MARARYIKPSLFKNEVLGVADPLLTILFTSLWCLADKSGRLEDRPLRIKAETFPYREGIDINRYLTELSRLGFIRRYQADGMMLIQIINFEKHQHPHHTEKDSEYPAYSSSCQATVNSPLTNGYAPSDYLNTDYLNTDYLNTPPPKKPAAIEIPEWINSDHWKTWQATRKGKKQTPEQLKMVIEKLEKWKNSGLDYAKSLEDAAIAGYQGLVEPKGLSIVKPFIGKMDERSRVAQAIWNPPERGERNERDITSEVDGSAIPAIR